MSKPRNAQAINFDPIRGRVFLEKKAPFTYPGEKLNDHGQLAQFHPRTGPAAPPTDIDKYYSVNGDDVPDLSTIAQDYAGVPPMPAFNTLHEPRMYRGLTWEYHVGQCHNMLYSDLPHSTGLTDSQIESLLAIASYGMGHSMTWLPPFYASSHNEDGAYITSASNSFSGMIMGNGSHDIVGDRDLATNLNFDYRNRIWGKRWLVVPIMYLGPPGIDLHHYGMSIFDRQSGHLYIQDTTYGDCPLIRDERIQTAVHLWARFWNNMGLAHHFQYYVCRGTPQPHNFECGWLGVLWVMQNLRDQVGERLFASGAGMDPELVWFRDVPIGNYEPENYPYEDSSLHLRDWMPKGFSRPKEGVQQMQDIFLAMLRNELGLVGWDTPVLANVDPAEGRMRDLMGNPSGIPQSTFWTSFGGTQFVAPRNWFGRRAQTHKAYNPNVSRRFHPAVYPFTDSNTTGSIINDDANTHNPPRPFNATFNGKAFTAANPLVRRNHPTKLGIGHVSRLWEDLASGVWEHYTNVSVLPSTDVNGISSRVLYDPNLRLLFSRQFSDDRKAVTIKYRASFLGGDTDSVIGNFTFSLNKDDNGYSSDDSLPWSLPSSPGWSNTNGHLPTDHQTPDAAGPTPEHDPEETTDHPQATSDDSPRGRQPESTTSRKRNALESNDAPEREQIPSFENLCVDSSSEPGSSQSSYSRDREKRVKRSSQGPLRRGSRVRKSTVFLGDPQRY